MQKKIKKLLHKTFKQTKTLKDKVKDFRNDKKESKKKEIQLPKGRQTEKVMVELSMGGVLKATLLIIALYSLLMFLQSIGDILILFFVSLLLAAALDPTVDALQAKKIPRALGILIIYFGIFIFTFILISQLIPLIASQLTDLGSRIAEFITNLTQNGESDLPFANKWLPFVDDFMKTVDIQTITESLQQGLQYMAGQLKSVAGNTWEGIKVIFNGLVNAFIVLGLTFFMIIEEENSEEFITSLFPNKYTEYIMQKLSDIKEKIGDWLRGQIVLSITMGLITGIGFWLMGVEYAATLVMIAAIAEFLPMIGPTITFLLGALIASNQSLLLVVGVGIWCIIMQILEGQIFIPLIMKKAIGLSPVIIILAMMIGFHFLGIIGIIISLPVTTVISIFINDYTKKNQS